MTNLTVHPDLAKTGKYLRMLGGFVLVGLWDAGTIAFLYFVALSVGKTLHGWWSFVPIIVVLIVHALNVGADKSLIKIFRERDRILGGGEA